MIKTLVLIGTLLCAACAPADPVVDARAARAPSELMLIEQAWADACRLSRYDCTEVPAPLVRQSKLLEARGAWGMYAGGNTVWYSSSITLHSKYSVAYQTIVHEMVHYLFWHPKAGNAPNFYTMTVCLSEEEAFEVGGKLARELGQPEHDRSKDWIKYYTHCQ